MHKGVAIGVGLLTALALPALGDPPPLAASALSAPTGSGATEPASPFKGGGVLSGDGVRGFVAFTFDDGPHEDLTPKVLDLLKKHQVPATFFVVGWRLGLGRAGQGERIEALERIIREGHDVGNHTFRHKNLPKIGRRRARREIVRAEELLRPYLGRRPFLFRPPFGALNRSTSRFLRSREYTTVRWNIDPLDWKPQSKERLITSVLARLDKTGGGIVLLHDTKKRTVNALPELLVGFERLNCKRLAQQRRPIVPTGLKPFVAQAKEREKEAEEQTERYLAYLRPRCAALIDNSGDQN